MKITETKRILPNQRLQEMFGETKLSFCWLQLDTVLGLEMFGGFHTYASRMGVVPTLFLTSSCWLLGQFQCTTWKSWLANTLEVASSRYGTFVQFLEVLELESPSWPYSSTSTSWLSWFGQCTSCLQVWHHYSMKMDFW